MDKQKFKPAKLLIWDLDNVIYPYDDAFNVACHEAAARAAVSLGFEDRGGGGR
jgi:FMN phosphatase YigB (HAD superfamily)